MSFRSRSVWCSFVICDAGTVDGGGVAVGASDEHAEQVADEADVAAACVAFVEDAVLADGLGAHAEVFADPTHHPTSLWVLLLRRDAGCRAGSRRRPLADVFPDEDRHRRAPDGRRRKPATCSRCSARGWSVCPANRIPAYLKRLAGRRFSEWQAEVDAERAARRIAGICGWSSTTPAPTTAAARAGRPAAGCLTASRSHPSRCALRGEVPMSWPITATPLSAPPPRVEQPSEVLTSPVGDYLRDPLGAFQNVLAHLRDLALTWGPIAGPVLAVAVTAAVDRAAPVAPPLPRAPDHRCPSGHRAGAADGRPVRRDHRVVQPRRPAAARLAAPVQRAAAPGLRADVHRRRRADPPVGARPRAARHGRARDRGRLARRAHPHHPRQAPDPDHRAQRAGASKRSAASCGWRARRRCRSAPSTRPTRSGRCSAHRSGSARTNAPACRSSPVRSPATG